MGEQARVVLLSLLLVGAPVALQAQESSPSAQQGARELPAPAREFVEDVARNLTRVQDEAAPLSCEKGVENARWGLETMIEVGQRNVDGGYLARADYEETAVRLKALLAETTLQDCLSADGIKREFYRCMSSDYNHVTACAQKYRY